MALRVLWVVKGLGPGGAERLLVAAARAHDAAQVEIQCAYVLPFKDHLVAALESAGVRCTCLSLTDRDLRWPMALRHVLTGGEFDVVHVHSPVPGSVARAIVRAMPPNRRPALMSTEHNTWARHRTTTRWLNKATSRWTQVTYAVSEETRSSIAGPAERHAQVLTHGIDVSAVSAERARRGAMRIQLGLAEDEFVIGTIANMTPQKDYPTLLAAARQLVDRGVRARIVAVGQGPLEDEVRAARVEMGLDDVVLLTGFRDDAVRVLAACDAFTLASAWEGLPVALMEALALGLPVVATNVGGVAEVMRNEEDALLVPAGNPTALAEGWARVVQGSELRARLASAAAARAPEFDVKRTVEILEATYVRCSNARLGRSDTEPAQTSGGARAVSDGVWIRPAMLDDRPAILALLQRSLGSPDPRYGELFSWKHDDNVFGPSPMWVAEVDGRVAAFRTFLRWEFVRGGEVVRAVRAVDTATDPEFQGRGLFRALTVHALEHLRADGVAFVFNTPNDQSRPGYLRMGWRDVGRVPAAFRAAGPRSILRQARSRLPADRWSLPLAVGEPIEDWLDRGALAAFTSTPRHVRELSTNLSETYLRWRYGLPSLRYRVVDDGRAATIVRARQRGEATELSVVQRLGDRPRADRLAAGTLREAGADYALRVGHASPASGFVALPGGGPRMTWRGLVDPGMPPLPNWALSLGDIELF